jgi:hypothetical protein
MFADNDQKWLLFILSASQTLFKRPRLLKNAQGALWTLNEAESIDSIDAFLIRKGTDIACMKIWDCKYVVHHKIQKGIWEAARQMIPNICKWQKNSKHLLFSYPYFLGLNF